MKFQLELLEIEATVKVGYYVVFSNNILKVIEIDEKSGMVGLEYDFAMTLEDASRHVCKLLGRVGDRVFAIVHTAYDEIIKALHIEQECKFKTSHIREGVIDGVHTYESLEEALFDGATIEFTGKFEKIYTSAKPTDVVIINDIKIIDAYKLYDSANRIAIIEKYDRKLRQFSIKLHTGQIVTCNRQSFKKKQGVDTMSLLNILCPFCKC